MNTPASSLGLRTAKDWKHSASINIPTPDTTHAITAPPTPVAIANRPGSVKTPAPTIEPTTSAVKTGRATLAGSGVGPSFNVSSSLLMTRLPFVAAAADEHHSRVGDAVEPVANYLRRCARPWFTAALLNTGTAGMRISACVYSALSLPQLCSVTSV